MINVLSNRTEETVSNGEDVSEQEKLYEKLEQNQQQNVLETEQQEKQPLVESKYIFKNKEEEHDISVVKDFLSKHQQT